MPQKKEKQEVTSPSPGLLQRLFGALPSDVDKSWPELSKSFDKMQRENPTATASTMVRPMGPIAKMLHPNAYGYTSPWGTVSLNRELMNEDKADLDSTLAHELVHVNQTNRLGAIRTIYNNLTGNQALEDEAYKAEDTRRNAMMNKGRDVFLPYSKR